MNRRKFLIGGIGIGIGSQIITGGVHAQEYPNAGIESEIGCPVSSVSGLSYDGESLWLSDESAGGDVYEMSTDGEVLNTFSIPSSGTSTPEIQSLVAYDDKLFTHVMEQDTYGYTTTNYYLVEVNKDGEHLRSHEGFGNRLDNAMTTDGEYMYLWGLGERDVIRQFDENVNIVRSIPAPEEINNRPRGLAYDGEYFWAAIRSPDRIIKMNEDGNILEQYGSPGGYGYAMTPVDGELFMINNEQNTIYVLDTDIEFPGPNPALDFEIIDPLKLEVEIDASETTHPYEAITTYRWDKNSDGTIDEETSSPTITHQYTEPGEHQVELFIDDDFGNTESVSESIELEDPSPTAELAISSDTAIVGESVTLDATQSQHPHDEDLTHMFEISGNDEFDIEESSPEVEHTFSDPGDYEIILQVEDEYGWSDQITRTVTIEEEETESGDDGSGDDGSGDDGSGDDGSGDDVVDDDDDVVDDDDDVVDDDDDVEEPTDDEIPGFGVGGALAGLGGAGYLLKRRFNDGDSN